MTGFYRNSKINFTPNMLFIYPFIQVLRQSNFYTFNTRNITIKVGTWIIRQYNYIVVCVYPRQKRYNWNYPWKRYNTLFLLCDVRFWQAWQIYCRADNTVYVCIHWVSISNVYVYIYIYTSIYLRIFPFFTILHSGLSVWGIFCYGTGIVVKSKATSFFFFSLLDTLKVSFFSLRIKMKIKEMPL